MRTLLLGMGNPILTDDAIGVRLARTLAPCLADHPDLDIVEECSVGGLELIDVFRGYERAFVLDSLRTVGGTPGHWHTFDAAALRDTVHLTNVHDANFATALELGRRLGVALPENEDIHVFAVEVEDDCTFSDRMSPVLESAFPACAEGILARIRALLGSRGASVAQLAAPSTQVNAGTMAR